MKREGEREREREREREMDGWVVVNKCLLYLNILKLSFIF